MIGVMVRGISGRDVTVFTENEIAYLKSQRLARLATVDAQGQPDVSPVGFEFDGAEFYIGGRDLTHTRKYKNVQRGQVKIALVIDDLVSVNPWTVRGIRIYGTAEAVERAGRFGQGHYLHITPKLSWSWGIEPGARRRAVHGAPA